MSVITTIKDKICLKPTDVVKENVYKPGNGIDINKYTISVQLSDNCEKTDDNKDFIYFENGKLTIGNIKDQIHKQIHEIGFGGEDRDEKDYIEMGFGISDAQLSDLFIYTKYGHYSSFPKADTSMEVGIATVEDTTEYVDRQIRYVEDVINSNLVDQLWKKADADNVDQTIRAEFLGAYGITMFDLEGRSRAVTMEHECFDNQHYVNINAEDRSGSAIIVMPNNGEKKHIAYKEEIDELRETITQLQNRIEELENKNK